MSLPRRAKPPKFGPIQQPTQPEAPHIAAGLDSHATMRFDMNGPDYEVAADDLDFIVTLGRGQYGQVDKVRHKESGQYIAVKRIHATDDQEERKRMLMDLQVNRLNDGRCPYVIRSFGALFREGDLWICMEVMDTSLENFYKQAFKMNSPMPEDVIAHITFAVVNGLQFLKELNIMHRDVKPSNILLSRNGDVKLCDFGISGKMEKSMAKTKKVGCELYMAPERVDPNQLTDGGFDVRSDVWSVGISLIEISTGTHPFSVWKNPFQQIQQVVNGDPPRLPDRFSPEFRDFVNVCCKKSVEERPKYLALLEHPFLKEELVKPMDISAFVQSIIGPPSNAS